MGGALLAALLAFAPLDGPVPDFALATHRGETLTRAELGPAPTIFGFVFLRCAGTCPILLEELRRLDRDLPPGAGILAVTVDPAEDTPGALARAAAGAGASDRWTFATTHDTPPLVDLLLALRLGGGTDVNHSNRLVLVRSGRLVGAYDALDAQDLARLRKDLAPRPTFPPLLLRLPALNASLNALTTLVLLAGLAAIRRKNVPLHKRLMLTAVSLSVLFLVSYLTYHAFAGTTRFTHPGWPRTFYLSILLSHTILAGVVAIGVPFLVHAGLTDRIDRHKRMARILAPIWLYVAVTGVAIYLMLYRIWPSADIFAG